MLASLFRLGPVELVAAADRLVVDWQAAYDIENRPLRVKNSKWKVVCFLGVECPLARLYGTRLSRLTKQYSHQGVRIVGVNSNPQDSADDIKRFMAELEISFPIIKDAGQNWAKRFGATRTTEVFVLDADDRVCYQGRIDDQYEPGLSRNEPTRHDLRAAIEALIGGRAVPVAKTQAVGCKITIVSPPSRVPANANSVVFTKDVAPILNQHCVECHRAGEIGPFALTDYDEVIGWGEMMLEVIDQGRMPPWHADPQFGKFVGARHLPKQARKILADWVAQGMPEGESAELPAPPERVAGWQMARQPDAKFDMRNRPFVVPAEGTVEYQYFVVDPQWKEDRWIRAAQVVPGNSAVVHHAIVFVRAPDGNNSDGIGWLGGYVPGQRSPSLPPG
ncbi:MAG: redoxin domain-containing protein, partial [Bythopirellula sp.]